MNAASMASITSGSVTGAKSVATGASLWSPLAAGGMMTRRAGAGAGAALGRATRR